VSRVKAARSNSPAASPDVAATPRGTPRALCLCLCAGLLLAPVAASAQAGSLSFLNRILGEADISAGKSIERLSSGRGLLPDDPANYAIYELLEKQIRALGATIRNQSDMLSYYRFEDAMLGNLNDAVQRIRELVMEGSDGILDGSDRGIIRGEIDQLYDQILDSLATAEFNKVRVFASLADSAPVKATLRADAHYRLDGVDALLDFLVRERASIGAKEGGLEYAVSGEGIEAENATGSYSQGDTDIGAEVGAFQREELRMMVDLLMLRGAQPG
jgi:flagellin-like hook-associated protein FlgL